MLGRLKQTEWSLVVFTLVVLVALVTATATSTASFSPYNGQWQGGSGLQDIATSVGADSDVTLDTATYRSTPGPGTVAVVLSPDQAYTEEEAMAVGQFVRRGGTLLVAEDFGPHANTLLADIGASSRFDGRLVTDEEAYYNSPTMPVARPNAPAGLLVDVDAFTLNHGTYVVANDAQVLVESSEFATVVDDDGDIVSTSTGPYPFVTAERVGDGTVIAVADSSALINVMLDRPGNVAFVRNVFARHDTVILDYSHGDNVPPVGRAIEAVQTSPNVQVGLGVFSVFLVGALTSLLGRGRTRTWTPTSRLGRSRALRRAGRSSGRRGRSGSNAPPPGAASNIDKRALADQLRDTRPEWDADRIERVAGAIAELSSESTPQPTDR